MTKIFECWHCGEPIMGTEVNGTVHCIECECSMQVMAIDRIHMWSDGEMHKRPDSDEDCIVLSHARLMDD